MPASPAPLPHSFDRQEKQKNHCFLLPHFHSYLQERFLQAQSFPMETLPSSSVSVISVLISLLLCCTTSLRGTARTGLRERCVPRKPQQQSLPPQQHHLNLPRSRVTHSPQSKFIARFVHAFISQSLFPQHEQTRNPGSHSARIQEGRTDRQTGAVPARGECSKGLFPISKGMQTGSGEECKLLSSSRGRKKVTLRICNTPRDSEGNSMWGTRLT